jgi:hypothetical protein
MFEIRLQKLDREWKSDCQIVDRPPHQVQYSLMGSADSLRSLGRGPSGLPTWIVRESVF